MCICKSCTFCMYFVLNQIITYEVTRVTLVNLYIVCFFLCVVLRQMCVISSRPYMVCKRMFFFQSLPTHPIFYFQSYLNLFLTSDRHIVCTSSSTRIVNFMAPLTRILYLVVMIFKDKMLSFKTFLSYCTIFVLSPIFHINCNLQSLGPELLKQCRNSIYK